MNLMDLFGDHSDVMKEMLLNGFQLVDFNILDDEDLRQEEWGGLLQVVMKHIFSRDLLQALEKIK